MRLTTKPAIALVLLAMLGSVIPALAERATVLPQASTATYQDWTLRCDHLPETPPRKVCEVVQAVRATDGQAVLAQIVLGRPAPDQKVKLIVQLPAGVWLPANVQLTTATGQSVTAIFIRCQQLCVAAADADETFVAPSRP